MAKRNFEIANKVSAGIVFIAASTPALIVSAIVGMLGLGIVIALVLGCGASILAIGKKWWSIGHTAFDPQMSLLFFGMPAVCIGWNIGHQFAILA